MYGKLSSVSFNLFSLFEINELLVFGFLNYCCRFLFIYS